MREPTATENIKSFIQKANNGEISKQLPTTTLVLTPKQKFFIGDLVKFFNINGYNVLFDMAVRYAEVHPPEPNDYIQFAPFIMASGTKNAIDGKPERIAYAKNATYYSFKEFRERFDSYPVNLRTKGGLKNTILLLLIHYAKNNSNYDLESLIAQP